MRWPFVAMWGVGLALALAVAGNSEAAPRPCPAVGWEQAGPLVEKRNIEAVLTNGIRLRGKAVKLLPEVLEVEVRWSSDEAVVPKGLVPIRRESVRELTVEWRQGPARALLAIGSLVGAARLLGPAVDGHQISVAGAYLLWGVAIAAGYAIGRRIDRKCVRIVAAGEAVTTTPAFELGSPTEPPAPVKEVP